MDETIGTSIMKSIASEELADLSVEFTEIAIDSFLSEGIAKNLPFYQVYKFVTSIRDISLMKKTYAFLFEHRDIPLSDRVSFLSQFETEKDLREFGELVISLIDRVLQIDKARIIGKLSRAHMLGKIDRDTFLILSESTDRLFLPDLKYLHLAYKFPNQAQNEINEIIKLAHQRLTNAGLMTLTSSGVFLDVGTKLFGAINIMGKLIIEIIFEDK